MFLWHLEQDYPSLAVPQANNFGPYKPCNAFSIKSLIFSFVCVHGNSYYRIIVEVRFIQVDIEENRSRDISPCNPKNWFAPGTKAIFLFFENDF